MKASTPKHLEKKIIRLLVKKNFIRTLIIQHKSKKSINKSSDSMESFQPIFQGYISLRK